MSAEKASKTKKVKKSKRIISNGKAYIKASFNNTIVYITDIDGNTLGGATAGGQGFKGSRKGTPYAAQITAKAAAQYAKDVYGMSSVKIYINGPGPGGESAVRGVGEVLNVIFISNVTGIPHNGCRPKKERRV